MGVIVRSPLDMCNIQIEITNFCHNTCSNCTRLCGHYEKPYFMEYDFFTKAVNSMIGYPKMTGIMGGEPLFHPEFKNNVDYGLVYLKEKNTTEIL
jgi:MoaA/NifB/PqqE/SkfB family radical SAM enzyme